MITTCEEHDWVDSSNRSAATHVHFDDSNLLILVQHPGATAAPLVPVWLQRLPLAEGAHQLRVHL